MIINVIITAQNDDLMWKVKELEETKESESKGERDSPNVKLAEELKSLKQQVADLQGTRICFGCCYNGFIEIKLKLSLKCLMFTVILQ